MRNIQHPTLRWKAILLVGLITGAARCGVPDHYAAIARVPAVERKIDSLLAIMTVEEKLGQLNQIVASWNEKEKKPYLDDGQLALVRQGRVGSFLNVVGAGHTRAFQKIAVEETRLHIPLLFGLDVIHGFRTIFPIPLAEASSWDVGLVEQAARVAAVEATAWGIHWTFGPMVDIARDPRWGRIAEGAGEDPYLGSAMAAAQVRGFQSTDLRDSSTLLACAKHFAAYGGAEGGRDYNTVDISERTLREIYLPPFKAAVDAGAGSLMSSFNEIGGVPSSANRMILTDILRKEWGFEGFVVSDWTAVEELQKHGIAANRLEAGLRGIAAGVDMDMVSGIYDADLPQAVRSGRLRKEIVDEAVRRVLRVKYALGLFDNPYRNCTEGLDRNVTLTGRNREVARRLATESIVLLKNDHDLLPLSRDLRTIALVGPLANNQGELLGPWAAEGQDSDAVSVLEGIRKRAGERATILTAKGCDVSGSDTSGFREAVKTVSQSDVVLVVVGEDRSMSGEASSRASIGLPGVQLELVQRIVSTGKPVVLILMSGRPLTIEWEAGHVPAILNAWFPGVEAGNAVADIVFGDANPSGRLPVTFARNVNQLPVYYNHKSTGRPFNEKDKYTSKYIDQEIIPLFPFGFGLSYTKFTFSDLRVGKALYRMKDTIIADVKVRNSGTREGDEVVQLYIKDEVASVTRPVKELKGFKRIHLKAGETGIVQFRLTAGDMAFYNSEMQRVTEPGWFTLFVGENSEDLQRVRFELTQ